MAKTRGFLCDAAAGEVSLAVVRRKLGGNTRTLKRWLREEGSSFQQSLDALRHSLANLVP